MMVRYIIQWQITGGEKETSLAETRLARDCRVEQLISALEKKAMKELACPSCSVGFEEKILDPPAAVVVAVGIHRQCWMAGW